MQRWRDGDRNAGNQLFERYFSSICRFFENKLQNDVEELVQSTFLACVNNRDQFKNKSSFRTYLFSIARYQLYGYFRDKQRDGNALDFGVTSLVDMGTSPRSRIQQGQRRELLLNALCALPLEQQVLLELYYWEGMEAAELADIFDVATGTVRTRLFRSRQLLRDEMAKLVDQPDALNVSIENLDAWARQLREKHLPR